MKATLKCHLLLLPSLPPSPPPTDREEIAIVLVLLDQKRRIRGATL